MRSESPRGLVVIVNLSVRDGVGLVGAQRFMVLPRRRASRWLSAGKFSVRAPCVRARKFRSELKLNAFPSAGSFCTFP